MRKMDTRLSIGGAILVIGILVAFFADIGTDTIFDGSVGYIQDLIGWHALVVMLFIMASAIFFFLYFKKMKKVGTKELFFLTVYIVSGLFFSLASGYFARARNFKSYVRHMSSVPAAYLSAVLGDDLKLGDLIYYSGQFSVKAKVLFALTIVFVIVTLCLLFKIRAEYRSSRGQGNIDNS